jgi:ubiquinol-cytochrome c reductase cytochrome b subunit
MVAVAAVLILLGGLIQINPIWQYGPYEPWLGTNGAQPDWYLGWLIGALRLMPGFDIHFLGHAWVPNPFWGGVLFPVVVFTTLYAWPWAERKITGNRLRHDLLDRPRDKPWRTALGAAFCTWVFIIFVAGAADRILRATETHPLRSFAGTAVRRSRAGGFEEIGPADLADEPDRPRRPAA